MKTKMITLIVALFSSVCVMAKEGTHATLVFENDTVSSLIGEESNGIPSEIIVQKVIRDADHNFLMTGGFYGTVIMGDSQLVSRGLFDCFTARFTPDGGLLWLRIRATHGNEIGHGVTLGPTGIIYVVGVFDDSMFTSYSFPKTYQGNTGTDGFLLMYDPLSLYCRTKVIVSGPGVDGAFAVITDIWGNIYVTGTYRETATIGREKYSSKGLGDVFLLKLTAEGDYIVTQTYGTEYGDERGVYLSIGYDSAIVNIYFDINKPNLPLNHLWFDGFGMKKEVDSDICNACIEDAFEKFNLSLKNKMTR